MNAAAAVMGRIIDRVTANDGARAHRPRASRAYVWFQLAGWMIYALIGTAITGSFSRLTPGLVATTFFGAALGGAGTHLLRRLALRRNWFGMRLGGLLLRLAAAIAVTALAIETGVWAFGTFVARVYTFESTTPAILFVTTFNWIVIVVLWVAVYSGIRFFRHYRAAEIRRLRLEVAAREAQLDALNAQIHPHFLFNALNTLRALVSEDPARARDLVTELAEILRYALQAGRRERVTLEEELPVVRAYLQVESARYEDRLRWSIDVPEPLLQTALPPMVLQTLVENAVRHGIAARPEGGDVAVSGSAADGGVRIRVTNPGRLAGAREGGVGLPNTRERLRLLYGERAGLDVRQEGERVVADLLLPAGDAAPRASAVERP